MKKKDRQISTLFFERTRASKNKKAMLEKGRVAESGDLLTAEVKLIFFRVLSALRHQLLR